CPENAGASLVERGMNMTRFTRTLVATALGLLFFAGVAAADSLELKDGRVLQGRYLGGTQALVRFSVNGEVQAFNVSEIVAVTFTGNYGNSSALPSAPAPQAQSYAPAPAPAPVAAGGAITIPAGQPMLVRMIDGVDSSKNRVGDIFH